MLENILIIPKGELTITELTLYYIINGINSHSIITKSEYLVVHVLGILKNSISWYNKDLILYLLDIEIVNWLSTHLTWLIINGIN